MQCFLVALYYSNLFGSLTLHGLVFLDEVLDPDQVPAPVGGGNDGFLLPDPGLFVLHVPEQLLDCQRVRESLLPRSCRLLQRLVHLGQTGGLDSDVLAIEMARLTKLVG